MNKDFLVERDNLARTKFVDAPPLAAAGPGEAVIRVERFALTANNITYGVAGDMIGYWQFFPAPDGEGRIPVWGIGRVADSSTDGVSVGQRYYGYFPMSSELKVEPEKPGDRSFSDGAAHRASLPPVYNQYAAMTVENGFDPRFDNHQMVYRPLFSTSFVLDDWLADNDDFGAEAIVVGSASSKTGFGLAYMLRQSGRARVIGLTSPGNRAFVEGLGLYDEVFTYDEVESLDAGLKTAYVDMSGNRGVLTRVHEHIADNLVCSSGVGITHYDQRDGDAPSSLPGAPPSMFFAPSQMQKRNQEWGPAVFQQRVAEATAGFFEKVDDWVTIEEYPFEELPRVYDQVLKGASPDRAYVVVVGD